MIAIGIRYLCGWAMATHPSDRNRAEWPPHPDRVFMALAAAHFETDQDPKEREVLEWLESLPNPNIVASEADYREIVTAYVPVNDTSMSRFKAGKTPSDDQVKSGLSLLPENRSRQARTFPVAIPRDDTVFLIWPTVDPPSHVMAPLIQLCQKVTYLGHSASLVQMWSDNGPGDANESIIEKGQRQVYEPNDGISSLRLRISGPGRIRMLESRFQAQQRPSAGIWQGYRAMANESNVDRIGTVFSADMLVLKLQPREDRRQLGLSSTLQITSALRSALVASCENNVPEWLNGRQSDGTKTNSAHVAIVPLAHVGRKHADGHLLGAAIVLPKCLTIEQQRSHLQGFFYDATGASREISIKLEADIEEWRFQIEDRDGPERPVTLRPETWTEPGNGNSTFRWASVTPIVLDRYSKHIEDMAEIIALSCERVTELDRGLGTGVRPVSIELLPTSAFSGAGHARRDFPPLPEKFGKSPRCHTHAILTFDEPLRGPLLLGAGRYLGYGFCRPLYEVEGNSQ